MVIGSSRGAASDPLPASTSAAGSSGFGLYVHFPFCERRCPYCDFPTAPVGAGGVPHRAYADRVIAELEARAGRFQGLRLCSIYFGGGSPSLWRPRQLARVIDAAVATFAVADGLEVTVEANPADVTVGATRELLAAGVNRFSLGVQALDDRLLALLGRRHSADLARRAALLLREAGCDNLSCDVICGVAGQSVAQHLEQLRRVLALEPEHVSVYALTVGARARSAGVRASEDDAVARMLERGRDLLQQHGIEQYEVSNFARAAARRARHNTMVWQGDAYLGLGASAHSLEPSDRGHRRRVNPDCSAYLAAPRGGAGRAGARTEVLSAECAARELVMLGLRTASGVSRARCRRRSGRDPAHRPGCAALVEEGLLEVTAEAVRPTARGIWFADELALRLW